MSEFNKYAKELDTIAKEEFSKYQKASAEVENTERKLRLDYDSDLERLNAKARHAQAVEDLNAVKREMNQKIGEIGEIRKALESAIDRRFALNPADIDAGTLALLQSGCMGVSDYQKMINDAENSGNITVIRLASKYAKDASESASSRDDANKLRLIYERARNYDGSQYTRAFDSLTNVYKKCCNNPSMIGYWDRLTGELVEEF